MRPAKNTMPMLDAVMSGLRQPACGKESGAGVPENAWISVLRRYFLIIALGNLLWEFLHLPLYTLWTTETAGNILFAATHCTGGDLLIASATLLASLLVFGQGWPQVDRAFMRVAALTITLGLAYTVFSEWLNVSVRQNWAYSDIMPVLPPFGTGLSPLLQWIVIPTIGFWYAGRAR